MTSFLLVRHGQSEWNVLGRWQGHADSPLTELGRLQAAHAARRLDGVEGAGPIDAIVSSDLRRAAETAGIIAKAVGITDLRYERALRERDAGAWEGLTRDEIEQRYPGWLDAHRRPDDFEPDEQLVERVTTALGTLADDLAGDRVVTVCHGGVIRAVERWLGAEHQRIPNLGGRWITAGASGWELGERLVLVDHDELTRPPEH